MLINIMQELQQKINKMTNRYVAGDCSVNMDAVYKLMIAKKEIDEALALIISGPDAIPLDFDTFTKTGEKVPKCQDT